MVNLKKIFLSGLIVVGLSTTYGCQPKKQGPLERAGERVDEIADNISEGEPALKKKGPLERAGEAVEDTFDGSK